jgi:hypothetical protein
VQSIGRRRRKGREVTVVVGWWQHGVDHEGKKEAPTRV